MIYLSITIEPITIRTPRLTPANNYNFTHYTYRVVVRGYTNAVVHLYSSSLLQVSLTLQNFSIEGNPHSLLKNSSFSTIDLVGKGITWLKLLGN
jgi:hypothetical protein